MSALARLAVLFAMPVLGTAALGQTFIVDVNNGPGTHFTSLAAAVAAVPDGATLEVRPGAYQNPVTIDGKALTVLGSGSSPGSASSTLLPHLTVRNSGASQAVTIHGLSTSRLDLANCAGPTMLDDVTVTWGWSASGCSQLVLARSDLTAETASANCTILAFDCVFRGSGGYYSATQPGLTIVPAPGLTLDSCDVVLRGCTVLGGDWYVTCGFLPPSSCQPSTLLWTVTAAPGIEITSCAVKLLACDVRIGNGVPFQYALRGTGAVRMDSVTTLTPSAGVLVTPAPVIAPLPRLSSSGASPGTTTTVNVDGTAGDIAVLLIGLPGAPLAVPGFRDPFWLSPLAYQFHAFGSVPLTATLALPPVASLRGLRLAWQAVTFGAAGSAPEVSNAWFDLVL